MVKAAINPESGALYGFTGVFDQLEDPGMPIPEAASAMNNIADDMVTGKRIDDDAVEAFIDGAAPIICHNASFDRPLLERRFPFFEKQPFACSLRQIDWSGAGIGGAKLDYIAYRLGFFFGGHPS